MHALAPKANICSATTDGRFGPIADIETPVGANPELLELLELIELLVR
jgi:hypothetical protein